MSFQILGVLSSKVSLASKYKSSVTFYNILNSTNVISIQAKVKQNTLVHIC